MLAAPAITWPLEPHQPAPVASSMFSHLKRRKHQHTSRLQDPEEASEGIWVSRTSLGMAFPTCSLSRAAVAALQACFTLDTLVRPRATLNYYQVRRMVAGACRTLTWATWQPPGQLRSARLKPQRAVRSKEVSEP